MTHEEVEEVSRVIGAAEVTARAAIKEQRRVMLEEIARARRQYIILLVIAFAGAALVVLAIIPWG